jgi:cytoskeleton-associated protein 5
MFALCREFGPKVVNLKTLIKKIPPMSEDRDKTIREETKKLTVELYRWIGPGFKGQLSSLKPVVVSQTLFYLFLAQSL